MKDANVLLRKCKDTAKEAALVFRKQSSGPKRLLVFTDVSLNSVTKTNTKTGITKEEKRTQAGWVILLADDTETLDNENVHVLNWVSRKLTRVSKSTLASEAIRE